MKWTLIYFERAQDQLAAIWTIAPDQADVTWAADLIERRLRRDPYAISELRDGNSRIMIEPPLVAGYDVSDDDRMVTVWGFWRSKK